MSDWQPIETAPKDGTRVLLFINRTYGEKFILGHWDDNKYSKNPRPYWTNDSQSAYGIVVTRENQPTHWIKIPEPPKCL